MEKEGRKHFRGRVPDVQKAYEETAFNVPASAQAFFNKCETLMTYTAPLRVTMPEKIVDIVSSTLFEAWPITRC